MKEASSKGAYYLKDSSGTNIMSKFLIQLKLESPTKIHFKIGSTENAPVIIVMDYAFGEQAYETIDELLKPYTVEDEKTFHMNVDSSFSDGKSRYLRRRKRRYYDTKCTPI